MKRSTFGKVAVAAFGLSLGVCTGAHASVIGDTPNASFADMPYSLSFGSGMSGYMFQDIGSGSFGGVAVSTTGAATLANNQFAGDGPNGQPIGFAVDTAAGPPTIRSVGSFASFDDPTNVFPNDRLGEQSEAYLGLQFDLADGTHYGYARFTDEDMLVSYGYQSEPGTEIVAGAPADSSPSADVPEPGSIAMLALGLALVGVGVSARRRSV